MFKNQKPYCKPGKSSEEAYFFKLSTFQDNGVSSSVFLSLIVVLFHILDLAS